MENNFKEIHIGLLIEQKVKEAEIDADSVSNFLGCNEEEVRQMYHCVSLDSEVILKWSKLLDYDFFRVFTQHLILYSPCKAVDRNKVPGDSKNSMIPKFKKNIYTKQLIEFILEQIEDGKRTRRQVIEEYRIPKTTLYKWIIKYKK